MERSYRKSIDSRLSVKYLVYHKKSPISQSQFYKSYQSFLNQLLPNNDRNSSSTSIEIDFFCLIKPFM